MLGVAMITATIDNAPSKLDRDFIPEIHPVRSRAYVIGIYASRAAKLKTLNYDDEAKTLREWWKICATWLESDDLIVGMNLRTRTLPFLIWRSWATDVTVPKGVVGTKYHQTQWNHQLFDCNVRFALGSDMSITEGMMAQVLRTGGRDETISMPMCQLWAKDRDTAMKVLLSECRHACEIARRIYTGE